MIKLTKPAIGLRHWTPSPPPPASSFTRSFTNVLVRELSRGRKNTSFIPTLHSASWLAEYKCRAEGDAELSGWAESVTLGRASVGQAGAEQPRDRSAPCWCSCLSKHSVLSTIHLFCMLPGFWFCFHLQPPNNNHDRAVQMLEQSYERLHWLLTVNHKASHQNKMEIFKLTESFE